MDAKSDGESVRVVVRPTSARDRFGIEGEQGTLKEVAGALNYTLRRLIVLAVALAVGAFAVANEGGIL